MKLTGIAAVVLANEKAFASEAFAQQQLNRTKPLGELRREHACSGLVVRDVQDPLHLPGDDLEAPGETHPSKRCGDGVRIERRGQFSANDQARPVFHDLERRTEHFRVGAEKDAARGMGIAAP